MAGFTVTAPTTNIERLDDANSNTNWSGSDSEETDFFWNSNSGETTYICIAQLIKTARDDHYLTATPGTLDTDFSTATGTRQVVIFKVIMTNFAAADTNGIELYVGSADGNSVGYWVFGSQYTTGTDYQYPGVGGWQVVCIDPAVYEDQTTSGQPGYGGGTMRLNTAAPTLTAIDTFQFVADANAQAKAPNFGAGAVDIVVHGTGLLGVDGSTGDGTFADFSAWDYDTISNRYGIVVERNGILYVNGILQVGSSATATYFTDTNRVLVFPGHYVYTGFCGVDFDIQNASTDIAIRNCVFNGRGAAYTTPVAHDTRPDYDVTGTSGAIAVNGCTFNGYRQLTLTSAADFQNNSFAQGGESITVAGASLNGSTFSGFTGAAGDAYIDWDVASDPDGELDDLTFTKGTNAHAAIELGTNTPTSITLRGWTVSGFNASDGQNDSVIYNNSAKTVTVNIVGNSGTISYRNGTSASTNLVINPVTFSVHVEDTLGSNIAGARVWVPVTSGAGGKPYQASVSIASSGTTATVTHTGHGLSTNDWVDINGATNDELYNGTFQITVTGTNTYTYTMSGTPSASPATGSTTSTFVVIMGTTDVDGDISATYSWTSDQPVAGRVRSASGGPYYKTSPISATIDSATGASVNVQMISDQ
jgi:hypothetical protein